MRIGLLKYFKSVRVPNINAIYSEDADVEDEEFLHASSHVRSNFLAMFSHFTENVDLRAANYFWNRGLELESCLRIDRWGHTDA